MDIRTIQALYDYNRWANEQTLDAAAALNEEQFTRDLGNSFRSVRDTLAHILAAEWIWLERWKGNSPKTLLEAADFPGVEALKTRWDEVESDRAAFIRTAAASRLEEVISYVNTRGQTFAYPLWQMMIHVLNHSTYHRGQITTLLRQLGSKPASTDLLLFYDKVSD
ncbi:MAG: DinB family protein [Terriglobia bacterium]|jgi:uncharacterized damage-inducible protein DinB